jgi:hypothetical protein
MAVENEDNDDVLTASGTGGESECTDNNGIAASWTWESK